MWKNHMPQVLEDAAMQGRDIQSVDASTTNNEGNVSINNSTNSKKDSSAQRESSSGSNTNKRNNNNTSRIDSGNNAQSDSDSHSNSNRSNDNTNNSSSTHRKPSQAADSNSQNDDSEQRRVRRRISRACDHCNASRRKCDGQRPCGHCMHTRSWCEYKRQSKKRGKAPSAPLQKQPQQAAAGDTPQSQSGAISSPAIINEGLSWPTHGLGQTKSPVVPNPNPNHSTLPSNAKDIQGQPLSELDIMVDDYQMFNSESGWMFHDFGDGFGNGLEVPQANISQDSNPGIGTTPMGQSRFVTGSLGSLDSMSSMRGLPASNAGLQDVYGIHSFEAMEEDYDAQAAATAITGLPRSLPSMVNALNISRSGQLGQATGDAALMEQRRINSLPRQNSAISRSRNVGRVRYPILQDTMHLLRPLIPDALAYDLLEAYFKVSPVTNAQLAPCAPPLVYRRQSFLRQEQPRRSTDVLLVSMLWLSAQTADIPVLNASVARRKYVRRKLLELTTKLLKPLNEVSFSNDIPQKPRSSSLPYSPDRPPSKGDSSSDSGLTDSLDEIMAYVHLAMVTSASEFKGASLRWWNIAFSLAHEAKLHQEILDPLSSGMSEAEGYDVLSGSPHPLLSGNYPQEYTFGDSHEFVPLLNEERKEERRRVWWFLYTMDRHLSFSYNKPLSLLDSQCQDIHRPCDDTIWQSEQAFEPPQTSSACKGPWFECTGPTFFGFFTPLVALLGEIVYFVQAQNHPRLGVSQSTLLDWKKWEKGIEESLKLYQQSIQSLLGPHAVPPTRHNGTDQQDHNDFQPGSFEPLSSPTTSSSPAAYRLPSTVPFQNRIAYAYSKTIVHVLFILLVGKWDPLTLLNDATGWLSSPSFGTTIGHAIDAASSAEMLLDLDPDAHFMPFFIGVYLFQGSLPLLLVADRLGRDAAAVIIRAADTMVRVQETGAMRMPAEYQTLFISVLRTALMEMQGRTLYVSDDPAARRRQVLKRYRWTREGRGLAC